MTQTLAIFVEAYRSLNSKKMFWSVLAISALVVLAFACVGVNEKGLKLLVWQIDNDVFNAKNTPPPVFYKTIFSALGIKFWLAWLATILALISTAGIFPDLITSGSVDLFVSKPISRLRLFITEYVAGLLFVTLQVTLFSLVSFLVIGLRGGVWEPGLFVAVPLVICVFSYLFSVCVFLGVLTRSTVVALLLTLLFWFFVWGIGTGEQTLLVFKTMEKHGVDLQAVQVEQARSRAAHDGKAKPALAGAPKQAPPAPAGEQEQEAEQEASGALETAHRILYGIKTVLPKTSDTIDLLQRTMIRVADLEAQQGGTEDQRMVAVQRDLVEAVRGRSVAWVVGTSLGFELVVLAGAALIFCRRDF